jgi:D-amino-acid dehydrogenase
MMLALGFPPGIVVQGISTSWAMSMGSGRVVADLITRRPPEIDLDGLTLDRYRRR